MALLVHMNVQVVFEREEVVELLLARGAVIEASCMGLLVVEETAGMAICPLTTVTLVGPLLNRLIDHHKTGGRRAILGDICCLRLMPL